MNYLKWPAEQFELIFVTGVMLVLGYISSILNRVWVPQNRVYYRKLVALSNFLFFPSLGSCYQQLLQLFNCCKLSRQQEFVYSFTSFTFRLEADTASGGWYKVLCT